MMGGLQHRAVVAVFAAALSGQPAADTYASRLETLALIQRLNADILSSSSATASLEKWCHDRRLADEPKIVAVVVTGVDRAPAADHLHRLRVSSAGEIKHRRVQLRCGTHVLSEADNWYVPGRLTAEMNRLLDTTGTPFGRVVQRLEPYRRTFVFNMLWSADEAAMPDALFEHRAILYTREHEPFSEVHEVYQRQILALPKQ